MALTLQGWEDAGAPSGAHRALFLSAAFFVDQANISRAGGDLLEPLVFAAIVQANLAPLRHDPELQRLAARGEALPDAARRPISINAVAQSLRVPYETVRRKVRRLVEDGMCVLTPEGAYVPQAAIASERHAAVQAARLERLMRFHDDLVAAGYLAPGEAIAGPPPPSLMRPINTALSQYMLRTADRMIGLTGDPISGFILMALWAANTAPLARHGVNPDADLAHQLTPCRAWPLANSLGMSGETIRRRLRVLARNGYARHMNEGWLGRLPSSERSGIPGLVAANDADIQRLFATVRELVAGGG